MGCSKTTKEPATRGVTSYAQTTKSH
jgi:hypothetical protein